MEGYTNYVKEYLNECELCNGNKKNNKIIPPVKIILDEGPKYRYIFDIYNIPETLHENTPYIYILDCVDHFSKFMNAYLLKNKTMSLVISKIKLFIINNGKSKIIQTDNGKEFDNMEMRIYCENNNIKFIKSSPYHPQTNGAVEIIHKLEQEYLLKRKYQMKENFDLEIELINFIFYHNNKTHSITGYIPALIRDTDDPSIIDSVNNNIIKSLCMKIKKNDNNIIDGCFVLISTKLCKKGNTFKVKNAKGKLCFRIPGIFRKFVNSNTALIRVSIKYRNYFKINDGILCDIKLLNWVDELVYYYFLNKLTENSIDDLDLLFDNLNI